jgi:thiol-disulfide isomerase/thioredoxin
MRSRIAWAVGVVLFLTSATAACTRGRDARGGVIAEGKRKAGANLAGMGLRGEKIDLSALKGNPVVLNFWASWCPPCEAEQPDLERAAGATRSRGVQFLGVNVRDGKASARSFLDDPKHKVSYPSLFDPALEQSVAYGVTPTTLPSTFVLDRKGRVAVRITGQVPPADELTRVIESVAAEPA